MVSDDEGIEVPGVGGHAPRKAARRVLSDIIEPRIEEIFAFARHRMEEIGLLEQISAGAVLTGGAALMEGMPEFAEEILGMPVRLGNPIGIRGITQLVQGPQYATGVGLVRHGAQMLRQAHDRDDVVVAPVDARASKQDVAAARTGNRIWQWLKVAF
jgi:cell division protein FtsA